MSNLVRHICEFTCSPHQSTFINVTATQVNPKNSSEFSRDGSSTVAFNYHSLCRNIRRRYWRAHHWAVHEWNLRLMQERPVPVIRTARLGSHVRWLGSVAMLADALVQLYGRRRRQQLRAIPDQLPTAQIVGQSWRLHAHGPSGRALQWIRRCEFHYAMVVVHTWLLLPFSSHREQRQHVLASIVPRRAQSPLLPSQFHKNSSFGASTATWSWCSSFSCSVAACSFWARVAVRAPKPVSCTMSPSIFRNIRKEKQLKLSKNSSVAIMKVFLPLSHPALLCSFQFPSFRRKIAITEEIDFKKFSLVECLSAWLTKNYTRNSRWRQSR